MKNLIEQAAHIYAMDVVSEPQEHEDAVKAVAGDFKAGADWMHAELTRWHSTKVELPEEHIDVEVKTDAGKVSVCNLETDDKGNRFWNVSRTNYMVRDVHVVGWREIHK